MPSIKGDDSGLGFGVAGTSAAGKGVVGRSKDSVGVQGESSRGVGVTGASQYAEGVVGIGRLSHGVRGESASADHTGVQGLNTNTMGGIGVSGQSATGIGVAGASSDGNGVLGQSQTGAGVAGSSDKGDGVSGRSTEANGVLGLTGAATGSGVFGNNDGQGNGVTGVSKGGFGVFGQTEHETKEDQLVAGVAGKCNGKGWGVFGMSAKGEGVLGETHAQGAAGVHGKSTAGGDGVWGEGTGNGVGVRGEGNNGVLGLATTSNLLGAGVRGENSVLGAAGVLGVAPDGFGVVGLSGQVGLAPGQHAGVTGVSDKGAGVAGWGIGGQPGVFASGKPAVTTLGDIGALGSVSAVKSPPDSAGIFLGNVEITGNLEITGASLAQLKLFRIDHPLDPDNKYLNHASVESSEMKTIYDGAIVLDDQGQAVVELPVWFDSLNTGFRYQLTPIGASAPDLHIAEEVSANRFKIAGGPARLKVCWQVTGIRHDSFARACPLVVEMDKAAEERGYFLHPEHQSHPRERGVAWARHPDLARHADQLRSSSGDEESSL